MKEMRDFEASPLDLFTLKDIICRKYDDDGKEYLKACLEAFEPLLCMPLRKVTYEVLLERAQRLLDKRVLVGGSKLNGTGKKKLPTTRTILKKLAYLSAAYSNMDKIGYSVENKALKVIKHLRGLENGM